MSPPLESMLWGVLVSFAHVFTVIAALKCFKKIAPVFMHAVSALLGLIALFILCLRIDLEFWLAFCVLAFCSSSYLFLFGAVYKSLTLRVLCTGHLQSGAIAISALDAQVTLPTFLTRVSLLIKMGSVSQENGYYFLTQKGRKTANFFMTIRRIFRVNTKAVYSNLSEGME